MEFPRQPGPVKITITSDHSDDVYQAMLAIRRSLENHYVSTGYSTDDGAWVINCYPLAIYG